MTSPLTRQPIRWRPHDPPTDLRLAAVHLRMGQLGLARAELEALAGSSDLDVAGLLLLAEARWRTGDLPGAGEAAQAYLTTGGEVVLAYVIAAESTAAIGRPGEARRLAGRALERADVPLDRLFAGMPRSQIWPVDAEDGVASIEDASAAVAGRAGAALAEPGQTSPPVEPAVAHPRPERPDTPPESSVQASPRALAPSRVNAGFWDLETIRGGEVPQPRDELSTASTELRAGNLAAAAIHLAVALRVEPDLAADVLGLLAGPAARTPELELVRGDALRLAGREDEARRAFAAAASGVIAPEAGDGTVESTKEES